MMTFSLFSGMPLLYTSSTTFSIYVCQAATSLPTLPPPTAKPSYTKLELCVKDDRKAQVLLNSFNKTILLNKTKRSNDWSFT